MRALVVTIALLGVATRGTALEWEFVANLSSASGVLQLVADPPHSRLLMGTTRGYRIYIPGTSSWLLRETSDTTGNYKVCSFLSDAGDSLALLTGRENAYWYGYIMDNSGLTALGPIIMEGWNLPGGEMETGAVWGLGKVPDAPDTLFASTLLFVCGYVLCSRDCGETWSSAHDFCAGGVAGGWDLEVAPSGDILVGYGGFDEFDNGIVRSSDGGKSWIEVSGDMPCVIAVGEVLVDPGDPLHYFARQGMPYNPPADPALGVYESLDGGEHWTQVLQGNISDLAMHPNDAEILVAVKPGGVLLTRDGGTSWENITGNLPPISGYEQCVVCSTDERIYIADSPYGMWATDLIVTTSDQSPAAQLVLTAYPNPFNPSTRLAFSLRHSAAVSFEVLDIQGRLVRRLLDAEVMAPGTHTVPWDGRDALGRVLPSGLYLARLEAGGERSSSRLLLLK